MRKSTLAPVRRAPPGPGSSRPGAGAARRCRACSGSSAATAACPDSFSISSTRVQVELLQHAVDAEAGLDPVLHRLEMDVGGAPIRPPATAAGGRGWSRSRSACRCGRRRALLGSRFSISSKPSTWGSLPIGGCGDGDVTGALAWPSAGYMATSARRMLARVDVMTSISQPVLDLRSSMTAVRVGSSIATTSVGRRARPGRRDVSGRTED